MPIRRKKFARRKRRIGRKTKRMGKRRVRGKNGFTSLTLRNPSGLPDRIFVKLKLHLDVTWTNTGGAMASAIFSVNSAFDPTLAIGTNQGYLFDQWAALYDRYRVHALQYRVMPSFGALGITSTSVRELIVVETDLGTAFGSARLAIEQPRSQTNRFQVNAGHPQTIKGIARPNNLLGVTKKRYNVDDIYQAAVTTNPGTQCYLHVNTYDPVGVADVSTTAGVYLLQYVEFFDRSIPAVSD